MKSYRELRESAAWRDVSSRGKIRVTGEDRARLLHAMTTNEVKGLTNGEISYAFFLSAQGRILADVNILCFDEHLLLDTEAETRALIYEHLDKFIIADDATLEDITGVTATVSLEGPRATKTLESLAAPAPAQGHAPWGPWTIAHIPLSGSQGFLLIGPASEKSSLIEKLEQAGAPQTDEEAFLTVRLEHAKPRFSEDITDRYLTQETGQMQAISFSKGCYLGQEIVERVRSRAQVHRRLLPLIIDSHVPPPPATKLQLDGKDVAEITSASYSPALEKTVALAYVRTDAKPGDRLTFNGISATVLETPPSLSLESQPSR